MRALSLLTICATGLVLASAGTSAVSATKPPDIPQSYLMTGPGKLTVLRSHVTYGASQFPQTLRVTPPDGSWWGAEWKSGDDYFSGGDPPNFGWVHLGHIANREPAPAGLVTIMTAYAGTPSVAATVDVLRTRGRGATYEAVTPVKLGGFSGVQFDGRIVGKKNFDHTGHYFVPFSPPSNAAKYYPDEYPVYGDVFRVIALDVRGKTVVVFIENSGLPESRFPAFLAKAELLLRTLRFPAAAIGA